MFNNLRLLATEKIGATIDKVGSDGDKAPDALKNNIITILNSLVAVIGLVCVVMVIIGGFTYMTSSGDASKVKKGKDTIMYGIVGLVIVALAFAIVNFVIANVLGQ